jgi:hypothetical protein
VQAVPEAVLRPGTEFEGAAEFALKVPRPGLAPVRRRRSHLHTDRTCTPTRATLGGHTDL